MCGICGVVQVDGRPRPVVDTEALAVLTDTMRHRGPDDRGTFSSAHAVNILTVKWPHFVQLSGPRVRALA